LSRRGWIAWLGAATALLFAAGAQGATPEQVTDAHRQAAVQAADQLLGEVVLPSGSAVSADEPSGDAHQLARPVSRFFFAAQIDRHAFWTTPASPASAISSMARHLAPGARSLGSGNSRTSRFAVYALPAVDPIALGPRQMVVDAVVLANGETGVRADAEVRYNAPRLRGETIPRQARVLTITMTRRSPTGATETLLSLTVARRPEVRRIGELVNALPFTGNWSGVAISCPATLASTPTDTFTFRAFRGGPALATVSEPADTPRTDDPCILAELRIGVHLLPGLMDAGLLLREAGALLGVKLVRR